MRHTTYKFYTDIYFGDTITGVNFAKWESREKAKFDYLTENRITEEVLNVKYLAIRYGCHNAQLWIFCTILIRL